MYIANFIREEYITPLNTHNSEPQIQNPRNFIVEDNDVALNIF